MNQTVFSRIAGSCRHRRGGRLRHGRVNSERRYHLRDSDIIEDGERDDHIGTDRHARCVFAASRWGTGRRFQECAGVLPRCRHPQAVCRLGDQSGSVAALLAGWNEKYEAVGNGAWAGSISYGEMAEGLKRGFATSSTDTGHAGAGAEWAIGHPEKVSDYAYRSEHEMAVTAKAVVNGFYKREPKLSYFNGCSTGGRQALVEAERYPSDFNGIIAGAAANPKAGLDAWRVWIAQAMFKDQDSIVPPSQFAVIHNAVLSKCDAIDGVKDGLIENPLKCTFDPVDTTMPGFGWSGLSDRGSG